MTDTTINHLRDRIGDSVTSVEGFTVEGAKVAEFSEAIGDDDTMYNNAAIATERGYDRVPTPLTFTRTSFFTHYRPAGVPRLGFDLGFDVRAELHGEQEYEFKRPVYVGDTLSAITTLTDAYEREGGSGGTMTFATLETEFVDESESAVMSERSTIIEAPDASSTDGSHVDRDTVKTTTGWREAEIRQPNEEEYPVERIEDIAVGDNGPAVIIDGLTPRDFVKYAGASGDFNPVHYDQAYARKLGNPDVFGQGMLTMGYASHFATDWFRFDRIRFFRSRFTKRIWPGDTLTINGSVTDIDDSTVTAELTASRKNDETVMTGELVAEFDNDMP